MNESMTYIARKPCGCVVFAIIDNPEHKKTVAKELAKCIRDGLTVERISSESFRTDPNIKFGCNCAKPVKLAKKSAKHDRQQAMELGL